MALNFYVYAVFFSTVIILSIRKKNAKINKHYKQEHER